MDATILTVVNKIRELGGLTLAGLVVDEYQRLQGVDREVSDLVRELEVFMAWLQAAELANIRSRDELVNVLLTQLRRPLSDAEDIVDVYFQEVYKSRPGHETRARKKWACDLPFLPEVPCFPFSLIPCFPLSEIPLRYGLSCRIKDVRRRLQEIQNDPVGNVRSRVQDLLASANRPLDEPTIATLQNQDQRAVDTPIGFGRHTESIANLLIGNNGNPRGIVAVTGESGVGKTTAVREVIRGLAVRRHFDACAWVCLPPQSRAERYLDQIQEQVQVQTHCNFLTSGEAVTQQILGGMKLLVVLDGMDRTDELVEVLRRMPSEAEGGRGSMIVITTRIARDELLDRFPGIREVVDINRLERQDCLQLLERRLLSSAGRRVYEQHRDEFAGKVFDISGGLPLAVVLLAGLVYFKDHRTQWDEAFDLLEMYAHLRRIKRILTVSYATMPRVLRLCLLYLAGMPPNVPLDADRLERLWSADGILESVPVSQRVFEAGGRVLGLLPWCIHLLSSRGLLQTTESSPSSSRAKVVCIHQEVQSFARERAGEAGFMEGHNQFSITGSSTVRGLSVQNYGESHVPMGDPRFHKLRILLAYLAEEENVTAADGDRRARGQANRLGFLRHSRFLRILDLQCARLANLPDSIGDMIHLRYLGLRSCCLTELPQSVAKLVNLETLDITDNDIEDVVAEFWRIDKLKHVLAKNIRLPSSAGSIASGRNLETVHGVVLSPLSTTQEEEFPLNIMHRLFSLALVGVTEAHAPALANALNGIRSVKRIRIAGGRVPLISPATQVDSLELDGNIIVRPTSPLSTSKLVLRSSGMSQALLDRFLAGAYIVELELLDNAFIEKKLLLRVRGNDFLALKKLKLGNLQALEEFVIGERPMPRLTTIQIFGCPNLSTIRGLINSESLETVLLYDVMPQAVARIQGEDEALFNKIKHVISAAWAG